ncbi:iron complex outermembrane recepter protein [Filimonas lacunae]|uniref:Iron complex outermembrane recepter protein n=1 Tax=Filimonas lacunae TaxID=477680 RepID=A0A173MN15_9BACT|nr:TonB-dependent receptor [Filimonas lacunae]BAV09032.1 outer membrane protein SusC, starch binding [Filimonas lacunae]SIS66119.1 iron complex outermembrane recepter protein [Filimonas lacunae]
MKELPGNSAVLSMAMGQKKYGSRIGQLLLVLLMLFTTLSVSAQQKTISGTVTNAEKKPMEGVSVIIKGKNKGTQTKADGTFTIIANAGDSLTFEYVGYAIQTAGTNSSSINIHMAADKQVLNDVVVIGYGTRSKKDLTGSVATVSSKDFQQGAVTTPDQLVTGKVAGVVITSNGGAPGAGGTIRVRGGTSLSASNNPLIVVDGIPLTNDAVSGVSNPLSLINPNDIETFNILKDASATAIYGNRASNGVIIITTKSGSSGKLKLNFNSVVSQSVKRNEVDVLNADQYRTLVNEKGTDAEKAMLGKANTNWQDEIYQKAFGGDYNLNATGGVKKLPYRLSAGYTYQDGILKTSNMKRGSVALNLTPSFFNNTLKVSINLKGVYQKTRFANEGAIGAAIGFDPTQPVHVSNQYGNFYEWVDAGGTPIQLAPKNPLGQLLLNSGLSDVYRSIGSIKLDYKLPFFPAITATVNAGYDISKTNGNTFIPAYAALSYQKQGSMTEYTQRRKDKLLDFYLLYTKDLKEIDSRMDATVGYSYQDFFRGSPAYPYRDAYGNILSTPIADSSRNTLLSVFARVNYTFKNKYLLTASVRRDGTSRFAKNNRWGNFPSAAFAWKAKEEKFLKNVTALSDFKVRAGFGITGNQEVGSYYPYLPIYTKGSDNVQYPFGDTTLITYRAEPYDPNIKWETTTAWNAGIDFGFLKNRITGTLDVYYKKTKDLLADVRLAAGANLSNHVLTNVGNIESKGIELAINANVIDKGPFTWRVSYNISYNNNKILKLSNVKDSTSEGILTGGISGATGNTIQVNTVGYAPQTFYVYKQVYDQNGNPVEGVYNKSSSGDLLYRYKSANPKVTMGFTSQMSYKKWDMSFVVRSNIGNYVYNNVKSGGGAYNSVSTGAGYIGNVNADYLHTRFQNSQFFSDYYVENASFLRMDNVSLGYNFGKILRNTASLRLSATVQNVFVITKYSGLDPEIASGIDNNPYPKPRIYSVGINLIY